jgi:hypothetical protein
LVFTISAKDEAELDVLDDELAPPRLPALVPPVAPVAALVDDPLLDVADVEALEVDPADTESPAVRFASETMVPLTGAYSFVLARAVLALLTLASALYTAA